MEVRIVREQAFTREEAARLGREILQHTPPDGPVKLLVHFERDLPGGIEWRLEWITFMIKHRKKIRVALHRDGYPSDGLNTWARNIGLDLRECATGDEAIAWLGRS